MAPSVLDGALLSLPHPVLDLGEGLFDWVEVGRVWRQVPEPGASSLDHLPDSFRLVASEIVENDDVAFAQGWQEKVLHISAEAFAVDRAVEDAGCRELVMAERAEECEGTPVTVRGEAARRAPLGPQPRKGAMLVLIQVSSMKTSRPGSSPACQDRQRWRLRETSARACSRANSVFFEPQPFPAQEQPNRVV